MKKTVLLNIRSISPLIYIFSTTPVVARPPHPFTTAGTFTVPATIRSIQLEIRDTGGATRGNPYPNALDSTATITDNTNSNSIGSTLYF